MRPDSRLEGPGAARAPVPPAVAGPPLRTQVIIWATLVMNAVLFVANLLVADVSGSHAVFSQAVYSVTDLIGSVLLLWGTVASLRPPDYEHPFGYGKERFFWAFSASLITFTISGLLVLSNGLGQIANPQPVGQLGAALIVVGLTVGASLLSIWITLRELRRSSATLQSLLESSHVGLKTIFYQDVVSVFGSFVAFGGIAIVFRTKDFVADGIAASVIGVLLILTGLVLAAESRELLVGKAISPDLARQVLTIVERNSRVRRVRSFQSMMLGPDDVLIALRVNLQDGLTTDQVEGTIDELASAVRSVFPSIRHLVIEPES